MTSQTKILLIGIDGLILQRAIDSGRAATLATLRADSYFSEMVVDMPTVSGPSWTTLLTGVTQQVHKVIDNYYGNPNQNKNQSQTFAMGGVPQMPNSEFEKPYKK